MVSTDNNLPYILDNQTAVALRTRMEVSSASQISKATSATSPNNRSLLFGGFITLCCIQENIDKGFYLPFSLNIHLMSAKVKANTVGIY